jgi:hypothetical protein
MQSQTGQDIQLNTKFIILYLFKCLDSKKLYFWVEVRCQIHTCIPVPKKATYRFNDYQSKDFLSTIDYKSLPYCLTTIFDKMITFNSFHCICKRCFNIKYFSESCGLDLSETRIAGGSEEAKWPWMGSTSATANGVTVAERRLSTNVTF